MSEISQILQAIEAGDPLATDQLLPLVYDELRQLAAGQLARELPGQSLNATALVHEAWIRLVGHEIPANWQNRRHFFGAAATAIRRILVDRARRRRRMRHGGAMDRRFVDLDLVPDFASNDEILALHEALDAFALHDEKKARLVELRFFAGMSVPEAAQVLGISPSTADRAWKYARAWLYAALQDDSTENSGNGMT